MVKEIVLTEQKLLNLIIFGIFLHCRVWSLCNHFLLQFSMDVFQTLYTHFGLIEDVHMGFLCSPK